MSSTIFYLSLIISIYISTFPCMRCVPVATDGGWVKAWLQDLDDLARLGRKNDRSGVLVGIRHVMLGMTRILMCELMKV